MPLLIQFGDQIVFEPQLTFLTLSRRRPLSYRNQSIDLLRKSMDWFLYDNDLRLERVKGFEFKPNPLKYERSTYTSYLRLMFMFESLLVFH